jgi:ribosomal protection tetracycline resistance protein
VSTLNLGILAHVDAGKTSLTERLLYTAGVIGEIGSVDAGSTTTDTLALERQRGITIKSAVVSFTIAGATVNLIDTPGHPDFIAEVERVLGVLDGAVLVVSAVEGVQAQTRVLMRTLRRLRIPTLVFVNKLDRRGADPARVLRELGTRLGVDAVAADADRGQLLDLLTRHDDDLLARYVADETSVTPDVLRAALVAQTGQALIHPVYCGSAITGAGIEALSDGIATLLPPAGGDPAGPLSGSVFKVDRGPAGERLAYLRLFSGTLHTRDKVVVRGDEEKVTGIEVFEAGRLVPGPSVAAGRIAVVRGLTGVRIGDTVGLPPAGAPARQFAPPTLETVVVPARDSERGALHVALAQLAEQDPLIDLRQDDVRGELSVSLYGEVQKEVIQATLADDFGLAVSFRETTTIHIERPAGTGEAVEFIATAPNPFLATVGLRVEPGPVGSGVEYRLGVELGGLPFSFHRAIEETVRESLAAGLHGWRVTDCVVTLTRSGYWARQSHSHGTFDKTMSSTSGDFRNLTPLVLMAALARAGTTVYEPMHRFRAELPADTVGPLLPVLARLRAVPRTPRIEAGGAVLEGEIPAAEVHGLEQRLPGLTRGEGVLESSFATWRPVPAPAPTTTRSTARSTSCTWSAASEALRRDRVEVVEQAADGRVGGVGLPAGVQLHDRGVGAGERPVGDALHAHRGGRAGHQGQAAAGPHQRQHGGDLGHPFGGQEAVQAEHRRAHVVQVAGLLGVVAEVAVGDVGQPHRPPAGRERVVVGHRQHHRLAVHEPRREAVRHRRAGQRQVDLQAGQRVVLVGADRLGQHHRDAGQPAADQVEEPVEDGVRADRGEAEPDRADLTGRDPPGRLGRGVDHGQDAPRVGQERLAGRGEPHLPAAAFQQSERQRPFQALDLPGERRLGEPEPLGGPAEVQFLGDRDEPAQLGERPVHAGRLYAETVSDDAGSVLDRHQGKRLPCSMSTPPMSGETSCPSLPPRSPRPAPTTSATPPPGSCWRPASRCAGPATTSARPRWPSCWPAPRWCSPAGAPRG